MQHVLNKEHLRRASLILVRRLCFLAFLSTERRIHQHVIEKLGAPSNRPPYVGISDNELPCQMCGSSIP